MENTILRLLASDGPFTVTFSPGLTTEQYADLNDVVRQGLRTKREFCAHFQALADQWGVQFTSDGTCDNP